MDYLYRILLPLIILIVLAVVLKTQPTLSGYPIWKWLAFYLIVNFIVELVANILEANNRNNLALYNFGMAFEVGIFFRLFLIIHNDKSIKFAIGVFATLFTLAFLADLLFIHGIMQFNAYAYTVACLLLASCCFITLGKSVINGFERNPLHDFKFWFSIGVLFCYLGNAFYLILVNKLIETSRIDLKYLSIISLTVNAIMYIMIAIGSACQKEETISNIQS